MATIPDRNVLTSMRRADLQKLCKERGLKANMKSEDLIDMLLRMEQPAEEPRATGRSSSMRIVSRAKPNSTARGRVGSMIVHDIDEEAGEPRSDSSLNNSPVGTMRQQAAGPSTRRRAKETQYKLGVGRPVAIGGSGARPPSSSIAKPRSRRGKATVIVQPCEMTIQEEEEESLPDSLPGPSSTAHDPNPQSSAMAFNSSIPISADEFRTYVSTLVEPLKAQIGVLQADLERAKQETEGVHSLRSSIAELTSQLATLQGRDHDRTQLVESLREELAALKLAQASEDVQMHAAKSPAIESPSMATTSETHLIDLSGSTKSSLGKRQRALNDTIVTGLVEPVRTGFVNGQPMHSSRKKAKLGSSPDHRMEEDDLETDGAENNIENEMDVTEPTPRPFTVFSGPEESSELRALPDGPPPNTHLSDLFTFSAMTPPNGSTPSVPTTSQGVENRGPSTGNAFSFNFSTSIFRPMTSTPAPRSSTALPPPEPPTSPSPAGPGTSALPYPVGGSRSKPSSRPISRAAQSQAQLGVTPVAGPSNPRTTTARTPASVAQAPSLVPVTEEMNLDPTEGQGAMYANPMRVGSLGVGLPGIVPLPMPPDTPDQPMKRTMYGTELEGDSRFGDFGVEGVAMGFWTGAAPRF